MRSQLLLPVTVATVTVAWVFLSRPDRSSPRSEHDYIGGHGEAVPTDEASLVPVTHPVDGTKVPAPFAAGDAIASPLLGTTDVPKLIAAGAVTRAEVDVGLYDRSLVAAARRNIATLSEGRSRKFVYRQCGFRNWVELENGLRKLAGTPREDQLVKMIAQAEESLPLLEQSIGEAFDSAQGLRVIEPGSAPLQAAQDAEPSRGHLAKLISTRLGDREFQLRFDSADFPELDRQLSVIADMKRDFWAGGDL